MPSYLEKEQFVPIKPFMAPMEAILNTYKTRLQYWGYGAGQVKQTYDQYNNLELTREDNQSRLGKYMENANKHVTASAQTDLSVADNRDSALTAFEPINKDSDIMGDHANTMHWNALKSRYDAARVRNGGKEFNQAGYDAVTYQQELFRMLPKQINTANGPVDSWKAFYSNKEQYMPYFDKTEELKKLSDMFKTDTVDKTGQAPGSPGYLLHQKNASWDKDKWQSFVETNASPQLKAQLALEGRADLRKSLVLSNGNVGAVYNAYNQQFTTIRDERVQEYGDKLASYKLALQSLDKSSPDYSRLRKEYASTIEALEGNKQKGVVGAIDKLRQENLDPKSISLDNLQGSEATAADLYTRSYFNKVGRDFAHKDIVEEYKMDGAYFANKNLQARYAEMTQDANQFKAEMDYKYSALGQVKEIADANRDANLAIAGMRFVNGKVVPINDGSKSYKTNSSAQPGIAGVIENGKNTLEAFESAVGTAQGTIYDAVQGAFFEAPEYISELTRVNGNTPLNEVTTVGGDKAHMAVAKFLSTAYWGKDLYAKLGIDISNPVKAQADFEQKMLTMPVANIKQWLNMAFSNKAMREAAIETIKGSKEGMKHALGLEIADKEIQSNIEGFNETYGASVKQVLSKYDYPKQVNPNSEAYKMGVRGYAQDGDGKFRIPTKDEIEAWEKSRYTPEVLSVKSKAAYLFDKYLAGKTPQQIDNNLYGAMNNEAQRFGLGPVNLTALRNGPTSSKDKFVESFLHSYALHTGNTHLQNLFIEGNNIRNDMYAAIGSKEGAGLSDRVNTIVFTDKDRNNYFANKVVPILSTLDNTNTEDATKLKDIILRNPAEAVTSMREVENGVDGKSRVTFVIDDSKLNAEDKTAYKDLVGKDISFSSTSEVLKKNYNNGDYLTVLHRPKTMTVDFPGQPDAIIKLRNTGSRKEPNFVITGTYYYPVTDATGNFMYEKDGTVKMNQATERDFDNMIAMAVGGNPDEEINKNPVTVYRDAYMKAFKMREMIKYINSKKPVSVADLDKGFQRELDLLK